MKYDLKYSFIIVALLLVVLVYASPLVYKISPLDSIISKNGQVSFECNASDSVDLVNMTLFVWNSSNSVVYSNTSYVNGTFNVSSWNHYFHVNGDYHWNCYACNNNSECNWSSNNRSFTVNHNLVDINIIYPYNNAVFGVSNITFNYSVNVSSNCTINITNSTGVFNVSTHTNVSNDDEFNITGFGFGNYSWYIYCVAYDNASNNDSSDVLNFSVQNFGSQINLSINKTLLNSDGVSVNDILQFKITVKNLDTNNKSDVWVFDDFNASFLNFTNQSNCVVFNYSNDPSDAFVDVNISSCLPDHILNPGESFDLYLNFTAVNSGCSVNFVEASESYSSDPEANFTTPFNIAPSMPAIDNGLSDETTLISPYIFVNSSKVLTFSVKRMANDVSCLRNITIILPNNVVFEGYNDSSINSSKYVFSNSSNSLIWNSIDPSFFCGEGPENFSVNISSNSSVMQSPVVIIAKTNTSEDSLNITLFSTSSFSFNGSVFDLDGESIDNALVVLNVYAMNEFGDSNLGSFSANTNSSGFFVIDSIPGMGSANENGLFYQLTAVLYNDSNRHYAMKVGANLPQVPEFELMNPNGLLNPSIYLRDALSIHLSVIGRDYRSQPNESLCNSTTHYCPDNAFNFTNIDFSYALKDSGLGYPVSYSNSQVSSAWLSGPLDRNYSLMVFPESAFPIYIDLFDIGNHCNSSGYDLNITGTNATCYIRNGTRFVNITVYAAQNITQFSGYSDITGLSDFRVVAFMLSSDNMLFNQDILPFNLGQMNRWPNNYSEFDDHYNLSNGHYSLFLPATNAHSKIMLFAFAEKSGSYYYDNYIVESESLGFVGGATHNFSMHKLVGNSDFLISSWNVSANWNQSLLVNTTAVDFYLVDSNGTVLSNENAFISALIDQDNVSFTKLADLSDGKFSLVLRNDSSIKNLEIFSQQYAPVSMYVDNSVLMGDVNTSNMVCSNFVCNITMNSFGEFDPFNNSMVSSLKVSLLKSNSSCDVPNPDSSCYIFNRINVTGFSPLKAILLGDLSLRLSVNNVSVHYVKTDLLASGPPDAVFANNNNSFDAWKFGSSGPEIYDYVLLSMPYNASFDNQTLKVTIPLLYDLSFNVIWNASTDNISDIMSDPELVSYRDYIGNSYESYLNGDGVVCNPDDPTLSSGLCYKDNSSHVLWIKIPHFSGVGPRIENSSSSSQNSLSVVLNLSTAHSVYDYLDSIRFNVSITNNGSSNITLMHLNATFNSSYLVFDSTNISENASGSGWVYWYNFSEVLEPGDTFRFYLIMNDTAVHSDLVFNMSLNASDSNNSVVAVAYLLFNVSDMTSPVVHSFDDYNYTSNSSVVLRWNASDNLDSNITCDLYLNSVVNASNVSSLSGAITTLTRILNDGLYLWYVNCSDDYNNTNTSTTYNFTVDTSSPVINSINLSDNYTRLNTSVVVYVNITELNPLSVVAGSSSLSYLSGNCSSSCIYAGNITLTTSNFSVNVTDRVSHSVVSVFSNFSLDNSAPVLVYADVNSNNLSSHSSVSNALNITMQSNTLNVSWNISEASLKNNTLYVDGLSYVSVLTLNSNVSINLSAGLHRLQFVAYDNADNALVSSVYYIKLNVPVNISFIETNITGSNPVISNVTITNSNGSSLNTTDFVNTTLNLHFDLNVSNIDVDVEILNFSGLNANWNALNFGAITNISSSIASALRQNSGSNITTMLMFSNMNAFLNDSLFGNGVKVFINRSLQGLQVLYFADDSGNSVYVINRTCANNASGPGSLPVTISSMCYYNTSSNITIWLPHLSGTGLANDTVPPTINITSPLNTTLNNSYFNLSFNVKESNPKTDFCWFKLSSESSQHNLTLSNFSNSGTTYYYSGYRYYNLTNGNYNITVNCTDQYNQSSQNITSFTILDSVAPNITVSESKTNSSATLSIASLYSYDLINCSVKYGTSQSSMTTSASCSSSGFASSFTATMSDLSAGTKYYYNVSFCDINGNCNSYVDDVTTSGSSSSSSDSDSSSSSSTTNEYVPTSYWIATRYVSDDDFEEGYTIAIYKKNRLRVRVDNETHYIGLISFNSSYAVINVSSDTQQAIIALGSYENFEVTGDDYYDIYVKFVKAEGNLATLTIKKIHEPVPQLEDVSNEVNETTENITTNDVNVSSENNESEVVKQTSSTDTKSSSKLWWIVLVVVVFVILAIVVVLYLKHKRDY